MTNSGFPVALCPNCRDDDPCDDHAADVHETGRDLRDRAERAREAMCRRCPYCGSRNVQDNGHRGSDLTMACGAEGCDQQWSPWFDWDDEEAIQIHAETPKAIPKEAS